MFLDARQVEQKTWSCNVCVVGGGAAGIALAIALKNSGLQLCLLESGGFELEPETQSLYEGAVVGLPYFPLNTARLRYFGGTTGHWAGNCCPLGANEFEKRDWVPYSGWPFSREKLDPYYVKAQETCELGPFNYDAEYWAERSGRPILPLGGNRVVTRIIQANPTRFGTRYREEIRVAQDITAILYANVTGIRLDTLNRTVDSVRVQTLTGRTFDVKAEAFVLAAGGLENPRLLLLNDIGNQNDLVGRFFMEHLVLPASTLLLPKSVNTEFFVRAPVDDIEVRAGLALRPEVLEEERILSSWSGFTGPRTPAIKLQYAWVDLKSELSQRKIPEDLTYHISRILRTLREVYSERRNSGDGGDDEWVTIPVNSHSEQSPNPLSRVTLSEELDNLGQREIKLDWRITDLERRSIRRAQEIISAEIGRSGLGRAQILAPEEPDAWEDPKRRSDGNVPHGSWHHMGATRMHEDPKQGVVDADCLVHGVKNLYIAGASVFPTGGFENPTLTIIALAWKLADHLKSKTRPYL